MSALEINRHFTALFFVEGLPKLKRKRELKNFATEPVKAQLLPLIGDDAPVVPIRYSKAFDRLLTEGVSIQTLVEKGGLYAWSFRNVAREVDQLMTYITK